MTCPHCNAPVRSARLVTTDIVILLDETPDPDGDVLEANGVAWVVDALGKAFCGGIPSFGGGMCARGRSDEPA